MAHLNVCLKDETKKKIIEIATEEELRPSDIVRRALSEFISRREGIKE